MYLFAELLFESSRDEVCCQVRVLWGKLACRDSRVHLSQDRDEHVDVDEEHHLFPRQNDES